MLFFFFKQKTAYEMRISDWSSDVCSSDLSGRGGNAWLADARARPRNRRFGPCKGAGRTQLCPSRWPGGCAARAGGVAQARTASGMKRPLSIVVLGLSLSSSWGNGHATTYSALLRAFARRGHDVLFLERDEIGSASWRERGGK